MGNVKSVTALLTGGAFVATAWKGNRGRDFYTNADVHGAEQRALLGDPMQNRLLYTCKEELAEGSACIANCQCKGKDCYIVKDAAMGGCK